MASASIPFTFSGRPYVYDGKGAWVFIALPKKTSKEIRQLFKKEEQGQPNGKRLSGMIQNRKRIYYP